jgi:Mg2+ and Co2+ transporter CorA
VVRHLLEVCEPFEMDHGLLVYLRDVGDHIEQVNDDIATLLDECRAFKDEYEHSIEVRQNGAMTAVTVSSSSNIHTYIHT